MLTVLNFISTRAVQRVEVEVQYCHQKGLKLFLRERSHLPYWTTDPPIEMCRYPRWVSAQSNLLHTECEFFEQSTNPEIFYSGSASFTSLWWMEELSFISGVWVHEKVIGRTESRSWVCISTFTHVTTLAHMPATHYTPHMDACREAVDRIINPTPGFEHHPSTQPVDLQSCSTTQKT